MLLFTLIAAWTLVTVVSSDGPPANRSFTVDRATQMFMKDGQPFRYVSGEMHYFRIPNEYWRDRLHKLRAMGANAVQTVVEWSLHEPQPGVFNFEGDADLIKYIQIAQEENLLVIIRAGPYICAERNMGGYPYWLLKQNPGMKIRSFDDEYNLYVKNWMNRLLPMLKPFLYINGGPIIMVQIENEYGYFGCDAVYLNDLKQIYDANLGEGQVIYFTTDPPTDAALQCAHIDKSLQTVDFGHDKDPQTCFNMQRKYDPFSPYINSEFYTGWLDHWTENHQQLSIEEITLKLRRILDFGPNVNVNFYMFHGGTSFGFSNGANGGDGENYLPMPTSYDYDAPCNEAGDLTPKYFAMRDVVISYLGDPGVVVPPPVQPKLIRDKLILERVNGSVFDIMDQVSSAWLYLHPLTFEEIDQPSGFVVCSHSITLPVSNLTATQLAIPGLHDRAIVYVNRVKVGVLSRMAKKYTMDVFVNTGDLLEMLVEDMGRINFGHDFGYKGLGSEVTLGGKDLLLWTHKKIHLDDPQFIDWTLSLPTVPAHNELIVEESAFYKVQFTLNEPAKDTFIHLPGWKKGVVLINGFNLGRYWPAVGPQVSLYLPGCKFAPDGQVNTILILEQESAPCKSPETCFISFLDHHEVNGTARPDLA